MAISKNDIIKINGIIIGSHDFKELDKVVEILTDELGRINAFAFSSRSQKSSKLASTRLFCTGIFELAKNDDKYSLISVDVKNYYEDLVKDYDKFCIATNFAKLIKQFTYENMDCKRELALICYAISALLNDNLSSNIVEKIFEIKLSEIAGINEPPPSIVSKINAKNPKNLIDLIDYIYKLPISNLFSFTLDGTLYEDFMKIKVDLNNSI